MGLFDFIKKKDSDSSGVDNYGQSSEKPLNFQFSRNENPVNEGISGENIQNQSSNAAVQDSPSDTNVSYDDVIANIIKNSYKEKEKNTKRAIAGNMWGSLAHLFGNTIAAGMGSRTIEPPDNNNSYNNAILNIKNGYEDAMLNYTLANAKANQAAKAQADKINLQFEKDKAMAELNAKLKGGLIDKQAAANRKMQIQKAKDAKELQQLRDNASMKRTQYAQQSQNQRAERGDQAAMEREKFRQQEITKRNGKSGTGRKKKYPVMKFKSSGKTYDLNDDADVARMYNKGLEIGFFDKSGISNLLSDEMTVDDMRQAILTATDQTRNVNETANSHENKKKTIEGFSTSSAANTNKKTIEGF